MYASKHSFADQYRRTEISARVAEADPHQLIALLFEGASQRIRRAQACLEQGDVARKGKAIGEACAIIGHLNGSLDHEAGGQLAANLSSLYDYIVRRLTEANLHNDRSALAESLDLLGEVESAWNSIPRAQRSAVAS
ncbi:flagellar export chaperone FliS [Pseudoxanthomonas sp. GW2]|jgi:flagellar biosynthetic protein FliS|uniref:flagellar export chaperone FliS n=1 Tax=Pseudoxanthomonas sp. GW2 TaxID=1211114 RepID=UPI0003145BA6|nr:flagellar export chaperone FliS [Pseudoxanthomonas sp. GW2]